ncbi:hypothetical protein QTP88_006360 [Uroleucon formosanum]
MSEEKRKKKNPVFPLGTLLWVKLLKRLWWPGIVVDRITIPQELLDYVIRVEPISAVVKFGDEKYQIVGLFDEVYLYSCDRKMEFVEKGFSLYLNQLKGLSVIGKFDMNYFKSDVISLERLIGGDIYIFENLKERKDTVKSIVKQFFTPTNTKKSKKKEVERKSLPAPKFSKTPDQPKPKPVSRPRTSTQSQVGKTYKPTATGYSCHSQVGCNFTTNRYDNLKRHMASHKNGSDIVKTKKSPTSSTPKNKRKNLKTKPSEVKKQKLQEELLKDWDNDGEDEDEELNTSSVQSSSNVAQSSNEEVVQTSEVLSSSIVQSSNEEIILTSEVPETSTSFPNQVFDFNENDNNTPLVELRHSKSDCSSTMDDDISETFESRITPDFINNTIFDATPSVTLLVEKSTEDFIVKPHGIHSNEIDNQTKSTELLLENTVNTLDQISSFENSLNCISSSKNNSDILTEDNNVISVSELSECGSLNKIASLYKDIDIETNGVSIPLVENLSTETEDRAIFKENTNDKEIVSNNKEDNQLNGTTIDENISIENSCSVDSASNKIDCEDQITKNMEGIDGIPNIKCFEDAEWKYLNSELAKGNN